MTGTYTLPDKLREYAECAVNLDELRPLMVKAADEIDMLRKALTDIGQGNCPGTLLDNLPGRSQVEDKGIFQERLACWMQRVASQALGAEDAL